MFPGWLKINVLLWSSIRPTESEMEGDFVNQSPYFHYLIPSNVHYVTGTWLDTIHIEWPISIPSCPTSTPRMVNIINYMPGFYVVQYSAWITCFCPSSSAILDSDYLLSGVYAWAYLWLLCPREGRRLIYRPVRYLALLYIIAMSSDIRLSLFYLQWSAHGTSHAVTTTCAKTRDV